jgi:hypothetical protein
MKAAQDRARELQEEIDGLDVDRRKVETAKDSEIAKLNDSAKTMDEALKAKDGEIAVLKQQLADAEVTPAKMNEFVIERLGVINKAKAILGDKYSIGEKANDEIRKDVVVAKMGDVAKTFDTPTTRGAFEALATVRQTDAVPVRSTLDDMMTAFSGGVTTGRPGAGYSTTDARDAAYAEYDRSLNEQWRGQTN